MPDIGSPGRRFVARNSACASSACRASTTRCRVVVRLRDAGLEPPGPHENPRRGLLEQRIVRHLLASSSPQLPRLICTITLGFPLSVAIRVSRPHAGALIGRGARHDIATKARPITLFVYAHPRKSDGRREAPRYRVIGDERVDERIDVGKPSAGKNVPVRNRRSGVARSRSIPPQPGQRRDERSGYACCQATCWLTCQLWWVSVKSVGQTRRQDRTRTRVRRSNIAR